MTRRCALVLEFVGLSCCVVCELEYWKYVLDSSCDVLSGPHYDVDVGMASVPRRLSSAGNVLSLKASLPHCVCVFTDEPLKKTCLYL